MVKLTLQKTERIKDSRVSERLSLSKIKEELEKLESLEEKKEYLEKILGEVKGKSRAVVEQLLKGIEELIEKTQVKDSLEQKMVTEIPAPTLPVVENAKIPEIKYMPIRAGPSPLEAEVGPEKEKKEELKYETAPNLYEQKKEKIAEQIREYLIDIGLVRPENFTLEGYRELSQREIGKVRELAGRISGEAGAELGMMLVRTFEIEKPKTEYERIREEREEHVHPKKYKSVRAQEPR